MDLSRKELIDLCKKNGLNKNFNKPYSNKEQICSFLYNSLKNQYGGDSIKYCATNPPTLPIELNSTDSDYQTIYNLLYQQQVPQAPIINAYRPLPPLPSQARSELSKGAIATLNNMQKMSAKQGLAKPLPQLSQGGVPQIPTIQENIYGILPKKPKERAEEEEIASIIGEIEKEMQQVEEEQVEVEKELNKIKTNKKGAQTSCPDIRKICKLLQ